MVAGEGAALLFVEIDQLQRRVAAVCRPIQVDDARAADLRVSLVARTDRDGKLTPRAQVVTHQVP